MNRIYSNIEAETNEWSYVNPLLHARRLNRILQSKVIKQAYHEASEAFASIKRWDSFGFHGYTRIPAPYIARDAGGLLTPQDVCTTDWDWDRGRGRPPLFHRYVCSQACHWLAQPNLLVVQRLFPDLEWTIVSSQRHTSVVCFDEHLIFDLNYSAMGVAVEDCLTLLFGDDFDDSTTTIYADPNEYTFMDGMAGYTLQLFAELDNFQGDEEQMLSGLRQILECSSVGQRDNEDDVDMALTATALMAHS